MRSEKVIYPFNKGVVPTLSRGGGFVGGEQAILLIRKMKILNEETIAIIQN